MSYIQTYKNLKEPTRRCLNCLHMSTKGCDRNILEWAACRTRAQHSREHIKPIKDYWVWNGKRD